MLDTTSMDAALKVLYTDQKVLQMVYKNNPFLAMIPKKEDFFGKHKPLPLVYGNPQGRSASFTRAQTRAGVTSSKLKDFLLTRIKDYSLAQIDNETLEASKNDAGAFISAASLEIDGAINSLKRSQAIDLFRNGWGTIGQIGSILNKTITLKNIYDVVNFEVGQEYMLATTENSGALETLAGSDGLILTAINRSTGVLTFGAANVTATIATAAPDMYLSVRGDREDAANPTMLKIAGLAAWNPYTAPTTGDSFFNVDRTADVVRLAGNRIDVQAFPIEEALIEMESVTALAGGELSHCFLNPKKYGSLIKALGSKVVYVDAEVKIGGTASVGFRGVLIQGDKNEIRVFSDHNCPYSTAHMINLENFSLETLGKHVRVIDTDGLQMLRISNSDGVEARYGYYGNMGCNAPLNSCNGLI